MVKVTKPVSVAEKVMLDTTRISLQNNVHRRITSGEKTVEISPDSYRHKFKREELEQAIKDTNRVIFDKDDRFEFKIHERTGRIMVKLIDNETDEIIKEIPPEKILDLVASIWDLVGILVDERG
ncbi:MAG: flagellar protein FlaG [Tissierellaceae bacterium]|nr:flagellar protein FlaG [Tissierellaceae bacterium]